MNKNEIDRILTNGVSKILYFLNVFNLNAANNYFDRKYTPHWSRRRKIIIYGVLFLFGLFVIKMASR